MILYRNRSIFVDIHLIEIIEKPLHSLNESRQLNQVTCVSFAVIRHISQNYSTNRPIVDKAHFKAKHIN